MKIAVTYENGLVFQHFGHTQQFKLYTVENGKITSSEVVDTNGSGHGALAVFLKTHGVDTLICGGIGGGARTARAEAGIALYPGARGAADAQAEALLAGTLAYDPDTTCAHHEHHGEGHEGCHGHHGDGHTCGGHCGHCPPFGKQTTLSQNTLGKRRLCFYADVRETRQALVRP